MTQGVRTYRVFVDTIDGDPWELVRSIRSQSSHYFAFVFLSDDHGKWLVPSICGFGDVALYLSGDAVTGDIARYWKQIRKLDTCCAYVLEGDVSNPSPNLLLFRNKYCEILTPDYVHRATPEQLAPWVWAGGKQNIGVLQGDA